MRTEQTLPREPDAPFELKPPKKLDISDLGENWKITLTLREITRLEAALELEPGSKSLQLALTSVRNHLDKLQRLAAS